MVQRKMLMVIALTLVGLGICHVVTPSIVAQERVFARAYGTVNVRSGPSTTYPVVGQLSVDEVVSVTARSDNENNWLQIEFDGQIGWVAYFTVTVEGDASHLPIRQLQSTLNSAPILNPVTSEGEAFVTLIRRVNVRSGPGTNYARLGTLQPGNMARILGRTTDNQWLQIEFEDRTGWVSYFVVGISGALDNVPFIEESDLIDLATSTPRVITVLTRFNSNLRAAPSFSAEILTVVPFNTELPVDARNENGNWLRVNYNGQNGWLAAVLVSPLRRRVLDSIPVENVSMVATAAAESP